MSAFADIHEEARKRQLRFLIIGGLAINHYGFPRDTADLELFDKYGTPDLYEKVSRALANG